jgi:hemolysin activation/secretion protein
MNNTPRIGNNMKNLVNKILFILITCLLTFCYVNAFAQPTPIPEARTVIRATDPSRVQRELLSRPQLPKVKAEISLPEIITPKTKAEVFDTKIKFKLNKIILQGVTVYRKNELAKTYVKDMHKKINLNDLRNIVDKITKKYRGDGYILSRAILPPQTIKKGVVHIKIIEGYISSIKIIGASPKMQKILIKYANNITKQKPLNMKTLERYLLLADDTPGISVRSVIAPSAKIPESSTLTIIAATRRFDMYFSGDNFGTRYLGPLQGTAMLNAHSILRSGDDTSFRFVGTSPLKELKFYELTHSQPIGNNGMRLHFGASSTKTNPGFTMEPLEMKGQSNILFSNLTFPAIRTRSKNLFYLAGLDYVDSKTTLLSVPYYHDKLLSLKLNAAFNNIDSYHGFNVVSLDFEQGIDALNANKNNLSRADGKLNFTKFNLYLSRIQSIMPRLSALISFRGQYAFCPLVAFEEIGYGGSVFGRGYDPSELIGDSGILGKLELRFNSSIGYKLLQAVQYYAFYDSGKIWNRGQTQIRHASATSLGGGIRIDFNRYLKGDFYLAKPLTRNVASEVLAGHNGKRIRAFFRIALLV